MNRCLSSSTLARLKHFRLFSLPPPFPPFYFASHLCGSLVIGVLSSSDDIGISRSLRSLRGLVFLPTPAAFSPFFLRLDRYRWRVIFCFHAEAGWSPRPGHSFILSF